MGRFRVTITIAAGYSEDDADRLLEAALGVCPHRRPDSGHDSEHGAVSVTISDEATDALTASDHGTALTAHIFRTAGLPLRQLIGIEVDPGDHPTRVERLGLRAAAD
ncbi:MAG: hypothetical protein ABWY90_04360 [Solirubrobacterales bacterium]